MSIEAGGVGLGFVWALRSREEGVPTPGLRRALLGRPHTVVVNVPYRRENGER